MLKEENTKLKEMVRENKEVEVLRQENRNMRQELAMIKTSTSPRLMIGHEANSNADSPSKTISDASYIVENGGLRRSLNPIQTQPSPVKRVKAQGSMSPQGGGFFMTQNEYSHANEHDAVLEELNQKAMRVAIEA